jgi:hypothetical protein
MNRALMTRVHRLEAVVDMAEKGPLILHVKETPADVGKDLWDVAEAQGILPPEILEGRRQVVLLPEKLTEEEWQEYITAYMAWEARRQPCPTCGIMCVENWCYVCAGTAERGAHQ